MLKFMRGVNTVIKCLTYSLKKFPISTSHLKLYCTRLINDKSYTGGVVKKQHSEAPIQNEILIYECDNSRFYLKLSVLSFLNYTLWSLLGISTYQLVSEMPEHVGGTFADENRRRLVKCLAILSVVLGTLLILSVWFYILRSIKTIILRKGSKDVIFETFTPFYTYRRFIVPLNHVSGVMSRHKVKGYIPLKIKNKLFYFLVDVNGRFKNHSVFDSSIALKRHFED